MILVFPVKFSVQIKTKTWALIGRSEMYAGKQSTKLIYLDPKSLIFEKSKTFMIYQGEAGCRSNSSGNSRTWEKAALVNDSQTHTHVHCQCLLRHYQVTMVVCASARQPLLHMILWKQAHNVWKNRSKVQISGKFKILNFKLKSHDFSEII